MSDGVDLVTGYRAEAHITSEDDGGGYASIVGIGNYVSADVGSAMAAEVPSANICRISDGEAWFGGRHVRIEPGAHVDVPIESGTQGQERRDIVAIRYTKDSTTGKEDCNLICIKGTPGSTSDPATLPGSPLTGATQCDMPLYRIPLSGISVGTPQKLFATTQSLNTLTIQPSKIAGTVPVSKGGTGITSNPSMLTNLGSTSAASVFATSPRPGIAGTLGTAHGGTGASSPSGACQNLIRGQTIWPQAVELGGTNSSSSGNGGFIDFHYNGSSADSTSRIIEDSNGQLNINGTKFLKGSPQTTLESLGIYVGGGSVSSGTSAGWHQVWTKSQFNSKFGGWNPVDTTIYFQDQFGGSGSIVYDCMVDGSQTVWLRARTDGGVYTGPVSFRFLIIAGANK